jgi:hypothetical protein
MSTEIPEIPSFPLDLNEFEIATLLDALIEYRNKVGYEEESKYNYRVLRLYTKVRKFRRLTREMETNENG